MANVFIVKNVSLFIRITVNIPVMIHAALACAKNVFSFRLKIVHVPIVLKVAVRSNVLIIIRNLIGLRVLTSRQNATRRLNVKGV